MITATLAERARELRDARAAFAFATVVRVQRPTSVRPGDTALVLADGTVEGFVGGVCAEGSVRLHGLRVLETGEPLLLKLLPDAGAYDHDEQEEGAVVSHNPCLSGGALEIFLEPCLPAPRLVVVGDAPVARALCDLGPRIGFEVVSAAGGPDAVGAGDAALVVASHGRDEHAALTAALTEGVPYVGLVASRTRGEHVRAGLGVSDALRGGLRTPVGLDIGARTPAEIALSILAEIVRERTRARGSDAAPAEPERGRAAAAPTPAAVPVTEGSGAGGGCCSDGSG